MAAVQPPPSEGLDAVEVGHVNLPPFDCRRTVALHVGDGSELLCGGFGMSLPSGWVAAGQDEVRAPGGKVPGGFKADAVVGPRYHNPFVLQNGATAVRNGEVGAVASSRDLDEVVQG